MKRIFLLLLTIFYLPAFVPPAKPAKERALPTFSQMVRQEEDRQQKTMPQLLQSLPAELRREILRINAQSEILNIPALAQGITSLARTNKALHAAINNPQNMLTILKSLPKAGALVLARGLRNMPGIKSNEVQDWLKGIKLEKGKELFEAVNLQLPDYQTINNMLENPNTNVNWKNFNEKTVLMAASDWGLISIVRLLLERGANVDAKNAKGRTALMSASKRGFTKIARLLLKAGAHVNAKDNEGFTAFMIAILNENLGLAKLFLANGANVNAQNAQGSTSLMETARRGRIEIVRFLLAEGANPLIRNEDVESAFDLAGHNWSLAKFRNKSEEAETFLQILYLLQDAEKAQKEKGCRK